MNWKYNFAHLILAGVVVLGLTLLTVDVDAQTRIVFMSERDGNAEIYVMDTDGGINKDSPMITIMTLHPHGLRTVNGLSLLPNEMETLKSM